MIQSICDQRGTVSIRQETADIFRGFDMNMMKEIGGGLTGIEQLRAFISSGQRPGIAVSLAIQLVEIEDGFAAFEGIPGVHAYNPLGTVHGGYAATLLDSACGCAVHSKLAAGDSYTTLELKIAYHKAISEKTGRVRAEARVLSFGRGLPSQKANYWTKRASYWRPLRPRSW
jgi:uncharacterized protein (TIGR00369 family)